MAETSYPYDNKPVLLETEWAAMTRMWADSGVYWEADTSLSVYGDSSGRQVKVRVGKAWMDGVYYSNGAEVILPITANSSGNTRIDSVAIKRDNNTNTCALVVVAGTPAGSPVAPTLTDTATIKYLRLADVTVANAAATISAGNVTDKRTWINRPNWIYVGDGVGPNFENSWVNYATGYSPASYARDSSGFVHLRGLIKSGTMGSAAFTLTAGFTPVYSHYFAIASNSTFGGVVVAANGTVTPQAVGSASNVYVSLDGIVFGVTT